MLNNLEIIDSFILMILSIGLCFFGTLCLKFGHWFMKDTQGSCYVFQDDRCKKSKTQEIVFPLKRVFLGYLLIALLLSIISKIHIFGISLNLTIVVFIFCFGWVMVMSSEDIKAQEDGVRTDMSIMLERHGVDSEEYQSYKKVYRKDLWID